jgi:hypothetical protein
MLWGARKWFITNLTILFRSLGLIALALILISGAAFAVEIRQNELIPPYKSISRFNVTLDITQDQNLIIDSPALVIGTPEAQKQLCFCAIDDSRRCVENGEYITVEGYNEKCEVNRRKVLGLPKKQPWYSDKMFMVS